jgi:hypothetical protein
VLVASWQWRVPLVGSHKTISQQVTHDSEATNIRDCVRMPTVQPSSGDLGAGFECLEEFYPFPLQRRRRGSVVPVSQCSGMACHAVSDSTLLLSAQFWVQMAVTTTALRSVLISHLESPAAL